MWWNINNIKKVTSSLLSSIILKNPSYYSRLLLRGRSPTGLSFIMSNGVHFRAVKIPNGEVSWEVVNDYKRDIARAAYADMLHDEDRNLKYSAAITHAIKTLHSKGEEAVVLDIGTGTGLLSMMAVRAGADKVYACECFEPMYHLSKEVTKHNKLLDKIKIIHKRSTDLEVGEGKDMETRANLLVTETFDTELIGEGCIHVYNHAREHLMEEGYLAVPELATLYGQLVESEAFRSFEEVEGFTNSCPGMPSPLDLQLSAFKPGRDFQPRGDIVPLFEFNFREELPWRREVKIARGPSEGGYDNLLLFWKLKMGDGEGTISCFPNYYDEKDYAWREHWMQWLLYVPPHLRNKEELTVSHDDYGYFLSKNYAACTCSIHRSVARGRICEINQTKYEDYVNLVRDKGDMDILVISDDTLLPIKLQKGQSGIKNEVWSIGNVNTFLKINQENVIHTEIDSSTTPTSPLLIIGDPHFQASSNCLDNLLFFQKLKEFKKKNDNLTIAHYFPISASILALSVKFKHLHKIRSPVKETCGIKLGKFDNLILSCIDSVDDLIESHSLFEYDFEVLEKVTVFEHIDLNTEEILEKDLAFQQPGGNGIVLFVQWDFGEFKKSNFLDDKSDFKFGTKQAVILNRDEVKLKYSHDTLLTVE